MITFLFNLLRLITWLYQLALLAYVVLSWIAPTKTTFMQQLARIIEPVLIPLRRLMGKYIPSQWMRVDWSPLAAWALVWLARVILGWIYALLI